MPVQPWVAGMAVREAGMTGWVAGMVVWVAVRVAGMAVWVVGMAVGVPVAIAVSAGGWVLYWCLRAGRVVGQWAYDTLSSASF